MANSYLEQKSETVLKATIKIEDEKSKFIEKTGKYPMKSLDLGDFVAIDDLMADF